MYYAAYGSNMNIDQMAYRCPNAKLVGTGYLRGWKLYFNYHASIKKTGDRSDVTPILIWDIDTTNLKSLDCYEGYPRYYNRVSVDCMLHQKNGNKKVRCLVYVMTDKRGDGYCLPDSKYVRSIAEGYMDNGVNLQPLSDALVYSAKNYYSPDNLEYFI